MYSVSEYEADKKPALHSQTDASQTEAEKCSSRDKCQEVAKEADAGSVESLDPEYKIHDAKKYALQKKNAAMCEHKKEKAI